MDRQCEYDIRNYVYNLNQIEIENSFNKLIDDQAKDSSKYEVICNLLILIENRFKKDVFKDDTYEGAGVQRTFLELYIKKIIKDKTIKVSQFLLNEEKYKQVENQLVQPFILCGQQLYNKQFKQMRGINKILIEENDKHEYYFKIPKLSDNIDSQDTYFWGKNVDKSKVEEEARLKNHASEIIVNKYYSKLPTNMSIINELVKITLFESIDNEILEACKESVKVDIDKIGTDFSSEVFKDKTQIIDITGAFLYISKMNLINNFITGAPNNLFYKKLIIFKKEKLIKLLKKLINISDNDANNIIDYFTIENNLVGGFNEYPLININETILWIPSSFIMNDLQFSIVNGHYEKKVKINNRDSTVSQSIVDNIINNCSKYKNIVSTYNKEYFDQINKYECNGKKVDLKSDIDVALYDKLSNSVLIIESKWKENVYLHGEKYDQICDAVEHIFEKQLNKHKYFLQLKQENIDFIFDNNQDVLNRPYYPNIFYIFVDKRIQIHYENRHALSEFNLLKLFNDYSNKDILNLDKVISYIKILETKVDYNVPDTISIINFKGKIIKNNMFKLLK